MRKVYFFIISTFFAFIMFASAPYLTGNTASSKINSANAKYSPNCDIYISSINCEMREKPSLASHLIKELPSGTSVFIKQRDRYGWFLAILEDGREGWINSRFLLPLNESSRFIMKKSSPYRKNLIASRGSSTAASVVQTAYKCLGIPYVWGGSSPSGFDCSGFVQWVYAENGVTITRTADTQYEEGTPVDKLAPGDLVFFTTYLPGASHVGIYLACTLFIHASSSGEVKISSLDDEFYKSVFIGGRRYFR